MVRTGHLLEVARYYAKGLDATLAYYSSPTALTPVVRVHGDLGCEILGHYNADELRSHLEEMLDDGSFRAAEEGIWVTQEYVNPATG